MKATTISPQYIKDQEGKDIGVFLTTSDFQQLLEESEELGDIRAFDKAKSRKDEEVIPFRQAVEEIRKGKIK